MIAQLQLDGGADSDSMMFQVRLVVFADIVIDQGDRTMRGTSFLR